jgi:putative flippase GtrA
VRRRVSILLKHWQDTEKLRFLVVGAVNTLVGYVIFAVAYLVVGTWLHYLLVALASHFLAVCIAYYLQRTWVFRSTGPIWPEFVRYNLSLIAVLSIGMTSLFLLVSGFGLPPLVAQATVTLLTVIGSYLAHRDFSFRS